MKGKSAFYCTECGNETAKWAGRCAACGAWNTLTEAPAEQKSALPFRQNARNHAKRISELDETFELRFSTGLSEMDRVLGGGAVRGSIVLVGGAPGIGKSTLLLQICGLVTSEKVLYVTGEESQRQIKMRARRLNALGNDLFVLAETELGEVFSAVEEIKPTILIIDSVQTMYNPESSAAPGSVGQVKDCTMKLMQLAKNQGLTAFVVGHINKEGAIAGPKVLEHIVDCVLYFEGERSMSYRVLRAAKNRFGSTNEVGVFEMRDNGLREVANPSEMMLSGRPENAPGSCVTCVMEGTRPILAEVQALVTSAAPGIARRTTEGFDYNRVLLLLAVLEKQGGLRLSACDAYVNVVGGLHLDEPAADLATILAIASSYQDKAIGDDLAAVGEIGLAGEIRSVQSLDQRLQEIARLGFKRCVIPAHVRGDVKAPDGLRLISVRHVREAVQVILSRA